MEWTFKWQKVAQSCTLPFPITGGEPAEFLRSQNIQSRNSWWSRRGQSPAALPGSCGPARTPHRGTRSRSSRTGGSSRWGSGWRGCTQPAETCTRCGSTRSPRRCTRTGCSGRSPESTIPPRSKGCRWPRRCSPAVRPPRSHKLPARKAAAPRRSHASCAPGDGGPWWWVSLCVSTGKG